MTNNVLMGIYGVLSQIKLNKISDRAARNTLINIHLTLHTASQEILGKQNELRKIHLADIPQEELLEASKGLPTSEETRTAVTRFNEDYRALMESEATIPPFEKISRDALCDACAESGIDITLGDLIILEPVLL